MGYEINAWQPIETAPKDGTTVLIYGGTFDQNDGEYGDLPFEYIGMARWLNEEWRGEDCQSHDVWNVHKPTHWMPLPEPPK